MVQKRVTNKAWYDRKREREIATRAADPIDNLTSEELAYLAGLIDGEGSIQIQAVGPHRSKTVYPVLVVAMTHQGVIEWMSQRLNAGSVKLNNHTNIRRGLNSRPQWMVRLFGKRAQRLCVALIPYLKVKADHARLVGEFPCDARRGARVTIDMTGVNETRYRLRAEITVLNKRGRIKT